MGVECSVAIATLKGAVGIGGADESIVNHATGIAGNAEKMQAKVSRVGRAVVQATVADIDGQTRKIKSELIKAKAPKPVKVTRSTRPRAIGIQVAGDNLVLLLIHQLGLDIAMNGNNVRLGCDFLQPSRRNAHNRIQ